MHEHAISRTKCMFRTYLYHVTSLGIHIYESEKLMHERHIHMAISTILSTWIYIST